MGPMINHQPGRTTFRLGAYAAAHCITINGAVKEKANIPAGSLIRDETEKLKAVILSQFVFADKNKYSPSFKTTVLDGAPVTRLNHAVPGSRGMFSAQALAISGMRNLEPVKVNGRKIGFVYEDDCARYCFLGNVFARNVKAPRGKQAEMVFETLAKALERHEFKFTDTVRTWFYNDRIIDWYGEFNKVRTGFFNKTGVFKKTVPASTGIGAGNPCGAALIGNLFAVQPKDGRVKIRAVPSPLQESALDYKSSFSRAVELEFPAGRCLLVSGTASIDKEGDTAFTGDVLAQIARTMRVVEALLKSRKMGWKNIFRGIVYFKRPGYLKYFKAYCRKHEIPGSNLAVAFTDMCRDDLLFEIELDALVARIEWR